MLAPSKAWRATEEPWLWPHQTGPNSRDFARGTTELKQGTFSDARGHGYSPVRGVFTRSIAGIRFSHPKLIEGKPGLIQSDPLSNPFPGLRPFEPDEDHLFFGREKETDELLRRLRGTRFLQVVGTSGTGKSSLVRSGLIPALQSGFMVQAGSNWRI